jgi:hypothetical protein
MQKAIWVFGSIAGILSALLEYLYFKSDSFNHMTMTLSKMAVLIVSVVFGLILVKKLLGGVVSIARTLLSGVLISLIRAAVMIAAFVFLYYPNGEFYAPKLQASYEMAAAKVEADESVKPADKETELETIKEQITFQFKPLGYSGLALASSLITGLIVSVLVAAFIAKNMMYEE